MKINRIENRNCGGVMTSQGSSDCKKNNANRKTVASIAADACLITGGGLLAINNTKKYKEMHSIEKVGFVALVAGVVLGFADIIYRAINAQK